MSDCPFGVSPVNNPDPDQIHCSLLIVYNLESQAKPALLQLKVEMLFNTLLIAKNRNKYALFLPKLFAHTS